MSGLRTAGIVIACGMIVLGCAKKVPLPPPPVAVTSLTEGQKGGITATNVVTASATVKSINHRTRMVTLLRSDGQRVRFRVSDEVQNLSQVKRGDLVNVTYYESVALRLRRPGEATPGVEVAADADRAKLGDLPAGAVAQVVTVTSKVVAVDRANQTATVQLPSGERLTVNVTDPKRLARVKVGDLVQATYRQAIAVAVDKSSR